MVVETLLWGAVAAAAGGIGFFVGSLFSPHAKVFREEAAHWRGLYGQIKRVNTTPSTTDPIEALLNQLGLPPTLAPLARQFIQAQITKYLPQSAAVNEKPDQYFR